MPQLAGFANSFASGEIAPDAWERSDLAQHATGCEQALNFIGLTSGPCASRGGFWNRGAPKHQDKVRRLFRWERSDGEGLVLEVGELYARVWTARGVPVLNAGVPVEFSHGFSEADLPGLRLRQVGDIAYVTSQQGLLYEVFRRNSDTSWSQSVPELRDGPFIAENSDPAKSFTVTFVSGAVWNIAANFDIFAAGHVGSLWRIRPPGGGPGKKTWAPNTATSAGDEWVSVGRIYRSGGGTTGNTPPTHDTGTVSDGAVNWEFLHDGACTAMVTAFTDARHVQVTVQGLGYMPLATGAATPNWAEGAFSNYRGFPTALPAVREERLVFAGTPTQPDTAWLSRTAGFTPDIADFKPNLGTGLVVDDDAVKVQVGDKRARIVWAVDALNLVIGTTSGEYIVSGGTIDDPITPSSVKARPISGYGSAELPPIVLQGPPPLLLHVARGAKTLRELQISTSLGDPQGRDLSLLAQHVFGLRVVDWAWQNDGNNLWLALGDGSLACFTYHYEHQIMGVRRQPLPGGFMVEALATSPDADGLDRLSVAAWRTKGGAPQRVHFVLSQREEQMFMDCAEQYEGPPITSLSGLSELAGEAVNVMADGGFVSDLTVSVGGTLTLPGEASNVVVGLPMQRRFKMLPFDPGHDGTAMAKRQAPRAAYVVMSCAQADVYAEGQDEPTGEEPRIERIDTRRPADTVPVVRRTRQRVNLSAGADRDMRVVVETSAPYDLVLYAVRPVMEAN